MGTPCKYSTHRATLMVMGMAAPRPLYVTSPPTAATIRRTMQVHGQTSTSREQGGGGEGGPHSTRAVLAVSAPRPHLYISALLPRPHDAMCFFLSSGFLSINSRLLLAIKTTVIISFYFLLSRSLKSLAILASAYHSLPTLVLY